MAIESQTGNRQIRVFVSSTFRDMKEERDYLVKFIFPQLRKICEQRGVTWGEVDLRWGVTDEQKAEGKVLPICLEEIKRCRPYFIGLLGERYGWIPDQIPAELIEREPWLQEHVRGKKSVTELEIVHGVLRKEAMHGQAFFYFRNSKYVEQVPPEQRQEFTTEDAEGAEKLNRLKGDIRHARDEQVCRLRENYNEPQQLGQWILEDFTALINELFPEDQKLDPLDRDAADHEAFAQSRAKVYIGRKEYFDRLHEFVETVSGGKGLVVLGESGSGKSALLANWAYRYQNAHPNDLLMMHFIGATPYSSDWAAMLRRIMGEFKRHFGIEQEIPDKPDALRSAFANWLHMAAAKGRVILILDALNQLEDRDGAPDLVWLPPVIPENVRLILSTLPGRPLGDLKKREWPTLEIRPLEPDERKQLITEYLVQYTKSLSPDRADRIARAPQTTNPLYLRALLEELRLYGDHFTLDQRINHYLTAVTVDDLYEKILERYEQDYEHNRPGLVRDAMTALWAARRGMSEAELLELLGSNGQPLPRAHWSPLYLAADQSLVSRSGLIGFGHDYMRQAVRDRYLSREQDQDQMHSRLADYFGAHERNRRMLDEFPWHLAQARRWQRLADWLTNLSNLAAALAANQFEVQSYWVQVEANTVARMTDAYRSVVDSPNKYHEYVSSVSFLLQEMGHLSESMQLSSYLVEHFRRAGNQRLLAQSLNKQAAIFQVRGDLDSALRLYQEQESICRAIKDADGLARVLLDGASMLNLRGDESRAMKLYQEQERISRKLGNLDMVARSLASQASTLIGRGDLTGASALLREAERIFRALGNPGALATALGALGQIAFRRGDLENAMKLHREEEQMYRNLGKRQDLGKALASLALILMRKEDLDGAMALLVEKELLSRELGDLRGLSLVLSYQASVHIQRHETDRAMALLKEMEQMCRKAGYRSILADALNKQSGIHVRSGDVDAAKSLLEEAEQIYAETGETVMRATVLENQAHICVDQGDVDTALRYYREAEKIYRELGDPDFVAISLCDQADAMAHHRTRCQEALPLAEEAYRLATKQGSSSVARQAEEVRKMAMRKIMPWWKRFLA